MGGRKSRLQGDYTRTRVMAGARDTRGISLPTNTLGICRKELVSGHVLASLEAAWSRWCGLQAHDA